MSVFPCFKLNDIELIYVNEFKYLGHIVEILGEALESDMLQYGFKKNCSTSHALFSFGESVPVRYFTAQGSQVYCVSLDASKAFDRVLHSGLFMKLANRGISLSFIKLLKYWYI